MNIYEEILEILVENIYPWALEYAPVLGDFLGSVTPDPIKEIIYEAIAGHPTEWNEFMTLLNDAVNSLVF